jgi:DNA-binding Xre family transcriptional regulator
MPRVLKNRLLFLLTEKERQEGKLISQAQLARDLEMSRPTIHSWLNNTVNKFEGPIVTRICDYFDCDVGDLLYFEVVEEGDTESK